MKLIQLTKNQVAKISNRDYSKVRLSTWSALEVRGLFYAVRVAGGKMIYMHREILQAAANQKVHHWDGDGTNNQRKNISICSHQENLHALNSRRRPGSSKFRGVNRHTQTQKWVARIVVNYKEHYLGLFKREIDAAQAYNIAAKQAYGKFGFQNNL